MSSMGILQRRRRFSVCRPTERRIRLRCRRRDAGRGASNRSCRPARLLVRSRCTALRVTHRAGSGRSGCYRFRSGQQLSGRMIGLRRNNANSSSGMAPMDTRLRHRPPRVSTEYRPTGGGVDAPERGLTRAVRDCRSDAATAGVLPEICAASEQVGRPRRMRRHENAFPARFRLRTSRWIRTSRRTRATCRATN